MSATLTFVNPGGLPTVALTLGKAPVTSQIPIVSGKAGAAFEQFCHESYGNVAHALGWALGSRDLGTEAADEAFARAFERWSKVSKMKNPAGWVYRVGLNWGRRKQWRRGREIELLSARRSPTSYEDSFADPDLAAAVGDLPMKLRAVVVARMVLDYSEAETAAALEISPGTVKSRLHRGLASLRQTLGDGYSPRYAGDRAS